MDRTPLPTRQPTSSSRIRLALETLSSIPKPFYSIKEPLSLTRRYADPDKLASLVTRSSFAKRRAVKARLHPGKGEPLTTGQVIQLGLFCQVGALKDSSDCYDEEGRFLGPQFLEPQYFMALQEADETMPFRLCRPWSLHDLLVRLATFKLTTWRNECSGLDGPSCARFGWINSGFDVIECRACEAKVPSPTDASQLRDGHAEHCSWRKAFCARGLYSIPNASFWRLAETTQCHVEILANHFKGGVPKVEHPLDEALIKTLLQKCGRGDSPQGQALVALNLNGWYPVVDAAGKLPGPSLRCWMCHRQLGGWNFAECTSGVAHSDLADERPSLDVVAQHRPHCPYVKPAGDGKPWPSKWLEKVAASYSADGKITRLTPWSYFPPESAEVKPFDWEAKKRTVTRFRGLLKDALSRGTSQLSKRQYIQRVVRLNSLSSVPYLTPDLLAAKLKSRLDALKEDLHEVSESLPENP
ncbi:hypothetical protein L0F63_005777 [Massospora cicadina]|nr:hypothetical protein L0F63_005777 [Massospora cicadina]